MLPVNLPFGSQNGVEGRWVKPWILPKVVTGRKGSEYGGGGVKINETPNLLGLEFR